MGILDEIEKIDDEEVLKASLKRIEKLEEENQKILKKILKILRINERRRVEKEGN